ncbi:hypothetical protein ACQU0X_27780 [Pseudovibrio ascidiaceicola]|uniref:hypothetical protein n=1 Tax=Pseudovibrio ascidiaceicola TaxID=285279 RepID=UPI003D36825E
MQSTSHPSAEAPILPAMPRSSAISVLAQLSSMALPLAASAIIIPALNLGTISVLTRTSQFEALEILSLLQPAFVFLIALMEGLGITNQVFSAKSKNNWPRRDILKSSVRLSIYGVVLLGFLSGVTWAVGEWLTFRNGTLDQIIELLPLFILSQTALLIFDVYNGAMRGQSKAIQSLFPFLGLAAISLTVTYLLIDRYGWGFEAVLVGNLAGPLFMLPVIALMVHRQVSSAESAPAPAFNARLKQLLFFVGGPVTASILTGSLSAMVIFPALTVYGIKFVSAFLIVMRFRIFFMIPAIAVASAIAILVNQVTESEGPSTRTRYLLIGVPSTLLLYAALTASLPYWSAPVLDLLVSRSGGGSDLRAATDLMMTQLQITFFLVAGGAMLQALLEQLGRGIHVLVIAGLTELVSGVATIFAISHGFLLKEVLQLQVAIGSAVFLVLIWQFMVLIVRLRRNHAF